MIRVHVMVEGQTEETFVRDVLYDHLQHHGVFLNPILLRTSTQGRGGVVSYAKVRPQLIRQCRQDTTATVTTMIDLYRLPGDFPGSQACVDADHIAAALAGHGYQKPFHGPLIAMDIGLEPMRERCPHFDAWLKRLEGLIP